MDSDKKTALWYDKKRTFLGFPLSFTKYYIMNEKLIIKTGFFKLREEEIRLYRILDISLHRSFGQRLCGLGTIHLCSTDKTTPELDLKNVKGSKAAKELLSDLIEKVRSDKNITAREFLGSDMDGADDNMH